MWKLLSRLPFRWASEPEPQGWTDHDPIDDLARNAFPRPTATQSLGARIGTLLPRGEAAPPRPWMTRPARLAFAGTLAALALVVAFSSGKRGGVAYADDAPTAGSLTILDEAGRAAALCPLKYTDVEADISGYVSRVTVKQQFRNPSTAPVEAVYTFPLPADAAVDDMTMVLGERVIKGEIKRREEARRIYEDARARGQAAALLDQERPNIFTQHVANIMPGQEVAITISYVNLLKYDDGSYEWSFPMVVGPRFTTGSSGYTAPGLRGEPSTNRRVAGDPGATPVETDAEKITPPIAPKGTRAGHNISVSVRLNAGVPLGDLRSVQHAVNTDRQGESAAVVKLKNEREIPNKDFILRFKVAGKEIETGVLAHAPEAGGPGYFTLILQPPAAPKQDEVSAKEMVFVIDQTGSQSGEPIRKAKEVMEYCIRQLNPDDTFQLLGFNTEVYPCFPAPVRNTPENVRKALDYLRPLEGEGGTDILKAVDHALRIPNDPGRLRMICYMTDGYVGNDMQILDYIRRHRGTTRMFPFGIGSSVNRFLIEGMAKQGRGAAEIVDLGADAKEVAKRFYERISQPLLLDPSVEWGELPVADVYPQVVPDVFSSGPIIVKGRYTQAAEGQVTIRGMLRGRPWSQTVPVFFPGLEKGNSAIPTLWAREKIEDLQSQDWLGQQLGRPDARIQEQIVGLALDYRLMTQHTSFVAVEQRVVNLGGRQRTVDVPVEMPEGVSHEGIFGGERKQGRGEWFAGRNLLGYVSSSPAAPPVAGGTAAPAAHETESLSLAAPLGTSSSDSLPSSPALVPPAPAGSPPPPAKWQAQPAPPPVIHSPTPRRMTAAPKKDRTRAVRVDAAGQPVDPLVKLDSALQGLAAAGTTGTVEVQIWLDRLPADGLAKLKSLGFDLAVELRTGKLLLGTIPAARLDDLAKLSWVRRIEKPSLK